MLDVRGPTDSSQEELEEALELDLEWLQAGEPLDCAVARFPELAAELRPSLVAAQKVQEYLAPETHRQHPGLTPVLARLRDGLTGRLETIPFAWRAQLSLRRAHGDRPWFGSRALYQSGSLYPEAYLRGWTIVEAALDKSRRKRPVGLKSTRVGFVGAIALLLLLFAAALWSQPDALASAMPGQPLYPVKRGLEQTSLLFAQDPASRAQLHLDLAARRLDETRYLFQEKRPVTAENVDEIKAETLATFDQAALAGPNAKPLLLARLLDLTRQEELFLNELMAQAGPGLGQELRQALSAVQSLDAEARRELDSLVPPPAVPTPGVTITVPALLPGITPTAVSTPTLASETTSVPIPTATIMPASPVAPSTLLPAAIVSPPPTIPSTPTELPARIQPTVPRILQPTSPTLSLPPVHVPTLSAPALPVPSVPVPTLALP